jgi:hypothetical protein
MRASVRNDALDEIAKSIEGMGLIRYQQHTPKSIAERIRELKRKKLSKGKK